ncbi:B12-binding domain-containing radical SAM protein [Kineothrix sedimenti]|uniref:B12-binding domain-containing radical SAM protein n=1 Tax=Kineothrix sedimenti TaxID=3123317 RepID=A0ABZ3EW02_9FIRM
MKFLLTALNAKYIHSNPALYSLRAYAGQEYASHIAIAEYTINHRVESILSDIYKHRPEVIAFSCYIWNFRMIREIITELHKIMPTLPIWLGGPEVSFDAEKLLKEYPMITGVMIGEGEKTFLSLLQYYLRTLGKESPDKVTPEHSSDVLTQPFLCEIPGIAFRAGENITTTEAQELTDISTLPFLYENLEPFQNRIIYYETSRGCPYRCSYCLSSIDKKVRLRDARIVKKELQFFLDNRVTQVKFVDRTFNCSHRHAMEIWRYIHEHDNGVTNFHFEIAADIVSEEQLEILSEMRPGLVQLEIGVQSTNPATLKEINRFMDMEKLKYIVKRIHNTNNIHVHLDLIAGLPYEDYRSFGKSFDEVYAMRPQQLQLGFLKVLKGSPMYEKAGSYGINYTSEPPYEVLYSKWMPYDKLCDLKRVEEMVELYYNSNQFTHTLPVLERAFEGAFAMYERLAEYYEESGYFLNSPSRVYRYEALLQFACLYDREKEALYKELLTYDIYLRENMKSRPGFSKDMTAYKEQLQDFYKHEEKLRELLPLYTEYQPRQVAKMTHIEAFSYAVWEESVDKRMSKSKAPVAVLFDYRQRSPLTNEARILLVPMEEG